MSRPDPTRIASRFLTESRAATKTASRTKTAGEVRFIKDRSGDKSEWAWGTPGPSEREMAAQFQFKPHQLKPLARSLRSTHMALGHAMSASQIFTKIKSANVSPDGSLGGKGYIQKIADMRRQYANCVEVLSALSDTIYDEINAPHWNPAIEEDLSGRDRQEVEELLDDTEQIREDPGGWAGREEAEMDSEHSHPDGGAHGKKARRSKTARSKTAKIQIGREYTSMLPLANDQGVLIPVGTSMTLTGSVGNPACQAVDKQGNHHNFPTGFYEAFAFPAGAQYRLAADRKWWVTKRGDQPYGGPAWKGDKPRWFDSKKEAEAMAAKLTERNPVGFSVKQIPKGFKAGKYPLMDKVRQAALDDIYFRRDL